MRFHSGVVLSLLAAFGAVILGFTMADPPQVLSRPDVSIVVAPSAPDSLELMASVGGNDTTYEANHFPFNHVCIPVAPSDTAYHVRLAWAAPKFGDQVGRLLILWYPAGDHQHLRITADSGGLHTDANGLTPCRV